MGDLDYWVALPECLFWTRLARVVPVKGIKQWCQETWQETVAIVRSLGVAYTCLYQREDHRSSQIQIQPSVPALFLYVCTPAGTGTAKSFAPETIRCSTFHRGTLYLKVTELPYLSSTLAPQSPKTCAQSRESASRQTYKSAVAACYFCNDVTAPAEPRTCSGVVKVLRDFLVCRLSNPGVEGGLRV